MAFNVVLDQPDAVERFRRPAREARVAGQLYALCGLLLVARPEGVSLAHSLSLKEATLIVRQGGFTFETPLVRGIVRGNSTGLRIRCELRWGMTAVELPYAWRQ